ncbi:hypothetical protein AVEN_86052-1 [Araneus ventricosus]|uniref:Uncharacterized protein n=1 Tax=Araneus ventricosus TaxID=182803 RepID=A0A4Y2MKB1_ARAVE|nr:hypothetical protein AVEN_86052-1 [Araneus ventricosus]
MISPFQKSQSYEAVTGTKHRLTGGVVDGPPVTARDYPLCDNIDEDLTFQISPLNLSKLSPGLVTLPGGCPRAPEVGRRVHILWLIV